MAKPCVIRVSGTSEIRLPPERCVASFSVSKTDRNPNTLNDGPEGVPEIALGIRKQLEKFAATKCPHDASLKAVTKWSCSTLHTTSWNAYDGKGNPLKGELEHQAWVELTAEFADFHVLGDLATSLASHPSVTVQDLNWILTPATKESLRNQAITDASKDAMAKAKVYAEALGRGAPYAIDITDDRQTTQCGSPRTAHGRYAHSESVENSAASITSIRPVPEEVVYQADCDVVFECQ